MRKQLEAQRPKGKWGAVKGIAEENDRLYKAGSFALPGGVNQTVPTAPPSEAVVCPSGSSSSAPVTGAHKHTVTQVVVANVDTVTAALVVGNACALNFANAETAGGRYRHGGRAQEEDLCRLLPQLWPSLSGSAHYPLKPGTALVTPDVLVLRQPGTYEPCASLGSVTIITAAMPCGIADRRPRGGWLGSEWAKGVTLRIRSVLHAARHTGRPNLILGAFGCGAFGNPAGPVAAIFREQLTSPEFRGAFACVVFAVLDPLGTGNLRPFRQQLGSSKQWAAATTRRRSINTTAILKSAK